MNVNFSIVHWKSERQKQRDDSWKSERLFRWGSSSCAEGGGSHYNERLLPAPVSMLYWKTIIKTTKSMKRYSSQVLRAKAACNYVSCHKTVIGPLSLVQGNFVSDKFWKRCFANPRILEIDTLVPKHEPAVVYFKLRAQSSSVMSEWTRPRAGPLRTCTHGGWRRDAYKPEADALSIVFSWLGSPLCHSLHLSLVSFVSIDVELIWIHIGRRLCCIRLPYSRVGWTFGLKFDNVGRN